MIHFLPFSLFSFIIFLLHYPSSCLFFKLLYSFLSLRVFIIFLLNYPSSFFLQASLFFPPLSSILFHYLPISLSFLPFSPPNFFILSPLFPLFYYLPTSLSFLPFCSPSFFTLSSLFSLFSISLFSCFIILPLFLFAKFLYSFLSLFSSKHILRTLGKTRSSRDLKQSGQLKLIKGFIHFIMKVIP